MTFVADHVRHSHLFGTLAEEEVREIVSACRPVHVHSGELVCRQGEQGESMFVIVSGRVRIDVDDSRGSLQLINYLGPGDHFGEMSMLLDSPRSANVTAVMDTELLELTRPDFERALARIPGFAANLSRSLGVWLRGKISGNRRPERMQIALVRGCPTAADLASQLAAAVLAQGGQLQVISDQAPRRPIDTWHTLAADGHFERQSLDRLASAVAGNRRTLVDIDPSRATPRLLMQQELVWWVVECNAFANDELKRLRSLLEAAPRLAQRIQLVWAVADVAQLPDANAVTLGLTHPPLRIQLLGTGPRAESFHPRDVARLTHHLRGIHLGLALGGGGARGIAHVGVLEVFEREGIYFDRVAGTSVGAIIAAGYAAGIPFPRILEVFEKEMTPSAALRWLPRARQWYLLALFRLGLAEAKFRRYLHDYTFEQLLLPAQIVTVDLVSGEHRVRSSGDLVRAVLESINHPVFGRPILRDGEALVDGAVLMNLPVTPLRQQNVDFSVAIDVSKQLSPTFGGNTKQTPTAQMRRPGYISTLLRVTDVELKNLAALHGSQCDFLIAPNTADFAFDDFSQGAQLVDAGRRAAEEAIPRLKQLLKESLSWDAMGWQPCQSEQRANHRISLKNAA